VTGSAMSLSITCVCVCVWGGGVLCWTHLQFRAYLIGVSLIDAPRKHSLHLQQQVFPTKESALPRSGWLNCQVQIFGGLTSKSVMSLAASLADVRPRRSTSFSALRRSSSASTSLQRNNGENAYHTLQSSCK